MRKTTSALDRFEKALAAEGITLPRHRLKHIAATVAGCRNDNEFIHRANDLYPEACHLGSIVFHGEMLHVLKDPRTGRLYAVDEKHLAKGQSRSELIAPCPYGSMVDLESAISSIKSQEAEDPVREAAALPLFRFTITREATESAKVEVRAETIEEAYEVALSREFWSNPKNAKFTLDEGNYPPMPYLPDEDDFEMIMPGDE